MNVLLALGVLVVVVAARRRRRDPEAKKRERGAYPYHNGPFA